MKTLDKAFEDYIEHVYKGFELPLTQERELKKAFFAGSLVTLLRVATICADDRMSGEERIKQIEGIKEELTWFAKHLRK